MPATWVMWSNQVYGEVVEQTPNKERYVVKTILQSWIDEGLSNERILLRYNAGNSTQCGSGYNKYNVWYDSCSYVDKGMKYLASL